MPADSLNSNRRGYALLLSVLIIGSIALVVVFSLSRSVGVSTSISRSTFLTIQAQAAASACAEEGLNQLRQTPGAGSGSLTLTTGSCTYTTTANGGNSYTILAAGTASDAIQQISIAASINAGVVTVSTWRDTVSP